MNEINPVTPFGLVSIFLFALALIPLFIHPTFRRSGAATGYLVATAVTAGGIAMVAVSTLAVLAAPLLLLYAALITVWTVSAVKARRRQRALTRTTRRHTTRHTNREIRARKP